MVEYVTEYKGEGLYVTCAKERITRCRDCAHAHPCPLANSEKLMCALHDEMFVNPDDFCSWGEPRGREADD